ncbi:hypothetical protein SDC9_129216 [bioreactor metagenome]|uniref:Uncharacterized protein n=1 Tax=bioreactor metagenome TaxID=1076179 RepID=A0A645CZ59_9ZZZZ
MKGGPVCTTGAALYILKRSLNQGQSFVTSVEISDYFRPLKAVTAHDLKNFSGAAPVCRDQQTA